MRSRHRPPSRLLARPTTWTMAMPISRPNASRGGPTVGDAKALAILDRGVEQIVAVGERVSDGALEALLPRPQRLAPFFRSGRDQIGDQRVHPSHHLDAALAVRLNLIEAESQEVCP